MRIFRAVDREEVIEDLRAWVANQRRARPELLRVGLFGSYAKGKHTPGSDLDVLIVVKHSEEPRWFMRSAEFDTSDLAVGTDLFIYSESETERMTGESQWFQHILREVIWID